ncbi:hypothetical protein BRD14_05340 [Halobacteriales archaeon SW_5_68_122]|nr:MAG: hypothetical protein BRD14_05340 [Halobacteriales archaeon SW_5_68_122]
MARTSQKTADCSPVGGGRSGVLEASLAASPRRGKSVVPPRGVRERRRTIVCEVAERKLAALGPEHDELTDTQEAYLSSWQREWWGRRRSNRGHARLVG